MLSHPVFRQPGTLHQVAQCLEGEHLASGREEQLCHILTSHLEAEDGNAGDNLKPSWALLSRWGRDAMRDAINTASRKNDRFCWHRNNSIYPPAQFPAGLQLSLTVK
jgi:hypothetical protein